ncbi:MAG TPA: pyrroloquinoline quinone biosynthesis peptide chaperone PqqD [Candidatus Baltobacteraceae bacterium]|jgi:pyrroloquinoline quinone biosynthesis protein D
MPLNAADKPRLGKGVRVRRETDGSSMLLVPEGALALNATAAATLELVDGTRSVAEIAAQLVERFDVDEHQASEDVSRLLERLAERRFVETS